MHSEPILVISEFIFKDICRIVSATRDGYETGVSLFGVPVEERRVVLAVAGPGPRAIHQPARYSPDNEYTNAIFNALRSALPSIQWLGELHVHVRGMPELSSVDHWTVRKVLLGGDKDTLQPEEFIAGVMQRKRDTIKIYPFYFTRACLDGVVAPIERADPRDALFLEARKRAALEQEEFLEAAHRQEHPIARARITKNLLGKILRAVVKFPGKFVGKFLGGLIGRIRK